MKKLLALSLLLAFTSLQAQTFEKSLLWKISGKGLENPSYIFGTIHATCNAQLSSKVQKALEDTNQLYLELDMDDPNMQSEMMAGMMMKDGKTLTQLANKKDFEIAEAFFQKQVGYPLTALNTVKPFFVSAMLIPKLLDCETMQSIEMELMKISKEQNEETFGLETIAEQMRIFDEVSYKDQMDEFVKSAKDDMVSDKNELGEMLKYYEKEDLSGMMETIGKSKNMMMNKHDDVLLLERNKNWIPRIKKAIAEKPTFFGVGAAHLGGKNGIIQLLREQGFTVQAVFDKQN